ncbi:MAG: PD-(D/E)XK nuclease domain-containing protein, partial [Dysgonamonadaceae bacterium]|nr:PD-(D/E)XK nuclease domain-containing protein [Dysgonamonadaceae bacterium]
GTPSIANPIYREVIARQLTYSPQLAIPAPEWQWQKPDGTLDMDGLLREFQSFWRTNSAAWDEMMNYTEAFPHLLLMAFLQRVINGNGRIEREYAAGRGRMDLAVEYNGAWNIIEVKVLKKGRTFDAVKKEGIRQTLRYRETFSPFFRPKDNRTVNAYLVIFDRRPEPLPWSKRLRWMKESEVTVVGC